MDSSQLAAELPSENIHRVPNARSLDKTEFPVPLTEVRPQPMQYDRSGEDVQTLESSKRDTAPDSPEAAGAAVQAST